MEYILIEKLKFLILITLLYYILLLHNKNIAHRDIKTDNILLILKDPIPLKLIDFGIS